uniref:Uncharacterized protein n=1 Tax=Oryza barthii TaxID=65489 RepID=A0A0D3HUS2_9ORYZ
MAATRASSMVGSKRAGHLSPSHCNLLPPLRPIPTFPSRPGSYAAATDFGGLLAMSTTKNGYDDDLNALMKRRPRRRA